MSKLHFTTKHANEATVQHNWYVVDGTNQTVGRMCAKIAAVLRGNTVYYWRVSLVPDSGPQRWNTSSFLYLPNGSEGFNQGHVYQHLKSGGTGLAIDSADRTWRFGKVPQNLFARNAMFPTGGNQDIDFSVAVNGAAIIQSACVGRSLVLNVFDARTFKPWINVDARNRNLFLYGSGSANCPLTNG